VRPRSARVFSADGARTEKGDKVPAA
jgi:hypothetical protein